MDIDPTAQGKVRDLYDLGDSLLLVASDRLSAFDVVLPDPIPHKGEVLTKLSLYWFDLLGDVVPNHLLSADVADLPERFKPHADYLAGRFMLVKKAKVFPVESLLNSLCGNKRVVPSSTCVPSSLFIRAGLKILSMGCPCAPLPRNPVPVTMHSG